MNLNGLKKRIQRCIFLKLLEKSELQKTISNLKKMKNEKNINKKTASQKQNRLVNE